MLPIKRGKNIQDVTSEEAFSWHINEEDSIHYITISETFKFAVPSLTLQNVNIDFFLFPKCDFLLCYIRTEVVI